MNINIEKFDYVEWEKLILFQPDDLKSQSKDQLEKLKRSLKQNGLRSPFLVWENKNKIYVLDGHHRIPAMKLLSEEGVNVPSSLPAVFIKCKDKREAKKAVLIYNAHYAKINNDILMDWIVDLKIDDIKMEIDIPDIRFDFNENKIDNDIYADIDETRAEELAEKYNIKIGQIWKLGEHRIACGDNKDGDLLKKLLNDGNPCICFTDPPYGVSISDKNKMLNTFQESGRNLTPIIDDNISIEELKENLIKSFQVLKQFCSDDCTFFVTAPQSGELGMMMMMMMKESGLAVRHVLMWVKNSPTFSMGRLDYDYQHEPIFLTWGKKHKSRMQGQFKTSVWKVDKPRSNKEHPTMKPVELYENALLNNSDKNDYAIDIFSGSGTMIIACERVYRKARCVEISPGYVGVAIQRWVDATGGIPQLLE